MNMRWLVMAKRWVQNPPSPQQIKFIAAIIGICLILLVIERSFGWPDWLTPNRMR